LHPLSGIHLGGVDVALAVDRDVVDHMKLAGKAPGTADAGNWGTPPARSAAAGFTTMVVGADAVSWPGAIVRGHDAAARGAGPSRLWPNAGEHSKTVTRARHAPQDFIGFPWTAAGCAAYEIFMRASYGVTGIRPESRTMSCGIQLALIWRGRPGHTMPGGRVSDRFTSE
jgi:hypothetical protein